MQSGSESVPPKSIRVHSCSLVVSLCLRGFLLNWIALAAGKNVCLDCLVQFFGYMAAALASYLLGSIPTGFLVAQAKGVDIRSVGSGNIGATNVFRALGKPAGIFVLVMDGLKGYAA